MKERIFDLPVCGYDRAKSFYGKAKIIETDNGEKVLQSYNTYVCKINTAGELIKLWSGFSTTTMCHVNSFIAFYGLPGGGKAWWSGLPMEEAGGASGGVAIVTGYAPFGNIRPKYEQMKAAEERAEKIRYDYSLSYEQQRERLKSLARDFIKGVCSHIQTLENAGEVMNSEKV